MSKANEQESYLIAEKTAISMLKQYLSDSLIKSVTGLSQDELDKIKNKL